MSDKGKGKSEVVSMELLWNEQQHTNNALERIEAAISKLPCDDLNDRVVKLEEFRGHEEKLNVKMEGQVDGAFKLAREAAEAADAKFWKLAVLFMGGGQTLFIGVLLYLLNK